MTAVKRAAGIGWISKKRAKENFTADLNSNVMNYANLSAVKAGSVALKQYCDDQKILSTIKKIGLLTYLSSSKKKMASIAMMIE